MYLPGSRTLRRLAIETLSPARTVANRLGCQRAAERLRESWIQHCLGADRASRGTNRFEPSAIEWARLTVDASEASGYFFSENLVSNESEYLSAADALMQLPEGLAYVGVGPEPMLSYLGLVDTPLAFVVDIRRDNARLHYLYRGIFESAETRYEWLSLLLGRPYRKYRAPGASASINEIVREVEAQAPTEAGFRWAHQLVQRSLDRLPAHLLPCDRECVRRIHRCFWRSGTKITFQLRGLRLRRYPTLESQLRASSPDGRQLGFLADEGTFRRVTVHQRASRIVPIVGDISGSALLRTCAVLRARALRVGAIYISNVEQYLFENDHWTAWVDHLKQVPAHDDAILIRSYFENDQGRVPDPPTSLWRQLERTWNVMRETDFGRRELPVHRMRTVVHDLRAFLERERSRPYQGYRQLVCDETIVRGRC